MPAPSGRWRRRRNRMSTTPLPRLFGRSPERAALDQMLLDARAGRSAVRVIRGEAGIGKSMLLDYVQAQASGATILRGLGVESDMELAYASLHQVCAPVLDAIGELPAPQRDALRVALGSATGEAPERFLVGLAVLTLVSRASVSRPVLVLVDDAQWLDRVSLQTLEFVARRLTAEPVAMVFAVRDPEGAAFLAGLPQIRLEGLDAGAAAELLESVFGGRLEDRLRERLVAETHGSPLALMELPRGRSAGELAYGLHGAVWDSISARVEEGYARRLRSLPAPTRTLLLVAAAEPLGDARLLVEAAEFLGIGVDTGPAKAAGLIEFGQAVRFRHPLARSAVYNAASARERRAVHRALAAVTDPDLDPDRRAWNAAQACQGPDEEAAAGLEGAADRARRRGGMSAEAVLMERSASLTPDDARRGRRALAAAEAHFSAGSPERAQEALALAGLCPLEPNDRARLTRLRARILFGLSRSDDASPLLLEAAAQFARHDSSLARETYLEAISATVFAGRVHGPSGAVAAATAALSTDFAAAPIQPADHLLEGIALLLTEGRTSGFPVLRRALARFGQERLPTREATLRWLLLAPVVQETFVHELWDFSAWELLSARSARLAREVGALGVLPLTLMYVAGVDLHHGDVATCAARVAEAEEISAATGYAPLTYALLALTAWRGDERAALKVLDDARASALERGEVSLIGVSGYAKGVLYNGLAQYDRALEGTREGIAHDGFNFTGWTLAEHVEAAVRSGLEDEAREGLDRLTERARAAATDWAMGIQLRCEALLSEDDDAGALFQQALERLEREGIVLQVARTHLLYGEWLRRTRHRAEARDRLRQAHGMFHEMGLLGFAERARRELRATGEHVRPRNPGARSSLTPQESQIAALAATGLTNRGIGTELFLSPAHRRMAPAEGLRQVGHTVTPAAR